MTRFSRLLLLLCFSLPAAGNSVIEMKLTAGLGAQAVVGYSTEIKISLFATSTTVGELQIRDANGYISIPVSIKGQTEKQLWLSVNPEPLSPLQVRLLSNTGEAIEKELFFEHGHTPITIISGPVPANQTRGSYQQAVSIRPVIIPPESLPRSFQAYAGIHAIVTDAVSLSNLNTRQYHAFADYLSGCNILLLSDASTVVLERVRKLSGCGGKFIQSYQTLDQVSPLLQELDSQLTVKLPAAQNLLPLQLPFFQHKMVTSITLYLAGYIAFMTLVNWRMNKTHYLLILPVIAAGVGILAWTGSGSAQLITWAETQSSDSHLRISSLLLLGGDRRGENTVTFDPDVAISSFNGKTQQHHIRILNERARRELSAQTVLLTPVAYQLSSVSRHISPFTLQLKQGLPILTFHAEAALSQARLLWQGYTYNVPVLAKGESWFPHETQKQPSSSAEEKLLQRHLEFDSPALLLPFTPNLQGMSAAHIQIHGWLVVRHEPEQTL